MAPKSDNAPACLSECFGGGVVTRNVPGYFASPVVPVVLRHATVPPAAVPEAPVYEDSKPGVPEHKIRMAEQRLMPAPARDASSAEDGNKPKLRGFVSARANSGHDLGALRLCDGVGH